MHMHSRLNLLICLVSCASCCASSKSPAFGDQLLRSRYPDRLQSSERVNTDTTLQHMIRTLAAHFSSAACWLSLCADF